MRKKLLGGSNSNSKKAQRNAKRTRKALKKQNKAQKTQTLNAARNQRSINKQVQKTSTLATFATKTADTKSQLAKYMNYCSLLQDKYDLKHEEVRDGTDKIEQIKDKINTLSDDILSHIRGIQELNNVSDNSNSESNNDYMGNDIGDNSAEFLRLLEEILSQIPNDSQISSDVAKLDRLIEEQKAMTTSRTQNKNVIDQKLGDIEGKINQIKGLSSLSPPSAGGRGAPAGGRGAPAGGRGAPAGGRGASTRRAQALNASLSTSRMKTPWRP